MVKTGIRLSVIQNSEVTLIGIRIRKYNVKNNSTNPTECFKHRIEEMKFYRSAAIQVRETIESFSRLFPNIEFRLFINDEFPLAMIHEEFVPRGRGTAFYPDTMFPIKSQNEIIKDLTKYINFGIMYKDHYDSVVYEIKKGSSVRRMMARLAFRDFEEDSSCSDEDDSDDDLIIN